MNWLLIGLIAGVLAGLAWIYRAKLGFSKSASASTGCVGCAAGKSVPGTTAAVHIPGLEGGIIPHGAPEESQSAAPLPFEPVSTSDNDKYETY